MHARQGLRQVAIALVGDDDDAAGLGDQEIGAGDADIGGEEFLAQLGARLGQRVSRGSSRTRVGWQMRVRRGGSRPRPVLAVQMEGGRDDVARRLVAELDDVFAEIGLDRRDAVGFEASLSPISSRDHRLALGDGCAPDARGRCRARSRAPRSAVGAQCTWPPLGHDLLLVAPRDRGRDAPACDS